MRGFVQLFAAFGFVAVALRVANEYLPFALAGIGLLLALRGLKLLDEERNSKVWNLANSVKPGVGHDFAVVGLCLLAAGLSQMNVDGNYWLLLATPVIGLLAATAALQKGASPCEVTIVSEVVRTIFAFMIPAAAMVLMQFRTETGMELLAVSGVLMAAATLFASVTAPRTFIRIAKPRLVDRVA